MMMQHRGRRHTHRDGAGAAKSLRYGSRPAVRSAAIARTLSTVFPLEAQPSTAQSKFEKEVSFGDEKQAASEVCFQSQKTCLQRKTLRKLQRQQRKAQMLEQRQRRSRLRKAFSQRHSGQRYDIQRRQQQEAGRQRQVDFGEADNGAPRRQARDGSLSTYKHHQRLTQQRQAQHQAHQQGTAFNINVNDTSILKKSSGYGSVRQPERVIPIPDNQPNDGVVGSTSPEEETVSGDERKNLLNRTERKEKLKRKFIAGEKSHGNKARYHMVGGEISTDEEEEDGGRRKWQCDINDFPSGTDEYILPEKATKRSKLQDTVRDSGWRSSLVRSDVLRQQRLQDEKDLVYLERQLGFTAPGISEEKKKKMVSKAFAALGLDDAFLACLRTPGDTGSTKALKARQQNATNTPLQEPFRAAQLHGERQQKRRNSKTENVRNKKAEYDSVGCSSTTLGDKGMMPCKIGQVDVVESKGCAGGSYIHQCEAEDPSAGVAVINNAGHHYHHHQFQTALRLQLTENATGAAASKDSARTQRLLSTATSIVSKKAACGGRVESLMCERTSPEGTPVSPKYRGPHKRLSKIAKGPDRSSNSSISSSSISNSSNSSCNIGGTCSNADEGDCVVKVGQIAAGAEKTGSKGTRQAAALKAKEKAVGGQVLESSGDSCEPSTRHNDGGAYYIPPHVRKCLKPRNDPEQRRQQQHEPAEGARAVFCLEVDTAAGKLQHRLRGLLNRASEGNVEVVLQQMVAAIEEASLQVSSSLEANQGGSEAESRTQHRQGRVLEYFKRRVYEGLATLFIENAIENKFSYAPLIATHVALCCALAAVLGPQLLRSFLEAMGRCFCRHFRVRLFLDRDVCKRNNTPKCVDNSFQSIAGQDISGNAREPSWKEPEAEGGKQEPIQGAQKDSWEGEEGAESAKVAMYTRHVIAAMCFLFDYGALPANIYLQLLERLTVAAAPEGSMNGCGFHSMQPTSTDTISCSRGGITRERIGWHNGAAGGMSAAAGDDAGATYLQDAVVLSESQVECLLLALRLGGKRLRTECPELFKEAWVYLMAKADSALHLNHVSEASAVEDEPFRVSVHKEKEGRASESAGQGRYAAAGNAPAEAACGEAPERQYFQQMRLRFKQRAAATPQSLTERLSHPAQATSGDTHIAASNSNGRLRFLVQELCDLKNNKSNACVMSSSAAAQDTLRRWLHTSPTLRNVGASVGGASSNCCAALRQNLAGVTWRCIEKGIVSSAAANSSSTAEKLSCLPSSAACSPVGGEGVDCGSAALCAVQPASEATAAAAATAVLKEFEGAGITPVEAGGKEAVAVTTGTRRNKATPELAAKLRFHTDNQKAIFSSLMLATDPNDAVQRLLQIPRHAVNPKQQVVDVVAVVLHSCLQEKTFNPFYATLLARLCGRCCCESRVARLQHPANGKGIVFNQDATKKIHFKSYDFLGEGDRTASNSAVGYRFAGSAAHWCFPASTFPESSAGARHRLAVEKLRAGCTCYTLPQKEALRYTRVLQRGVAAQTSAAHGFPLRRLLHLAKLEAFLIRVGVLELRLIRFLNFEEAGKDPVAGHMGLAGKFGAFLKELCTELLCDQHQASVPIPEASYRSPASVSATPPSSSPLPFFFSVCNLPDVREALLTVLHQQVSAETRTLKTPVSTGKTGNRPRLNRAVVERVMWLLKEGPAGLEE